MVLLINIGRGSLLTCLFCLPTFFLQAQTKSSKLYVIHRVTAGQTFTSIAANYNLSAEELAQFNNVELYDGPLVSKTIKIPVLRKPAKKTTSKREVERTEAGRETVVEKEAGTEAVVEDKVVEKKPPRKVERPIVAEKRPEVTPVEKTEVEPAPIQQASPLPDTTQVSPPPIIIEAPPPKKTDTAVTTQQKQKGVNASPTKEISLQEILPMLIFLVASIILLIAAIFFYKSVKD